MVFLSGGLVHFGSNVQRITAQSTSEAELIAMNSTAKHGLYFATLLGELGWADLRVFKLFADNRSSLTLASTANFSQRSRHIAVRYAALREWIQQGRVKLHFIASVNMLADICTKYCVRDVQDSLIRQVSSFT